MMDVSLDTDITIHLYNAGKEELLFKYFDKIYIHEFILEKEMKNKSIDVYNKIHNEINNGKIILVNQRYFIDIGMKKSFEDKLYEVKILFDFGEANAVALASVLGIAALITDDTKEHDPHDTLVNEYIEDIIPFAFYELLYLEYLQSDDAFDQLKYDYDIINHIAYPEHPMDFLSRMKRIVRRFSSRGSNRDFIWMNTFCEERFIDYKLKMRMLHSHLIEEEKNRFGK